MSVACFKRLAFLRLFVAFSVWRMFVALVALIWLLEGWGRIPSSGVPVWYMHSHPMCLHLLFVVRSVWHCLVRSSLLSVCFFALLAITVAVSDTRSVLRLLAGIFSFFFSCVHLALASIVGKLLFACSAVACVTTWRSTSSALLPVFIVNLLSPSLFAVTVAVWRSSSVVFSFLAACCGRYWVRSELVYCHARGRSMPPPTRSTNNSLSAGLTPEGVPPS